jgi:hypothetical protein
MSFEVALHHFVLESTFISAAGRILLHELYLVFFFPQNYVFDRLIQLGLNLIDQKFFGVFELTFQFDPPPLKPLDFANLPICQEVRPIHDPDKS